MNEPFWQTITPSTYDWERDALEFVRAGLPDEEPWRAWSNFEFPADDGSMNEVDLLVLGPAGFFLIEIKSWPGTLTGDLQNWILERDGRTRVYDNPLALANRKAKRLKNMLRRQRAAGGVKLPFMEALVFLSHPDLDFRLEGAPAQRICVRDGVEANGEEAGILRALTTGQIGPLRLQPEVEITPAVARKMTEIMRQLGISQSRRQRRVGDYTLDNLLFESPTGAYQDYSASHVALPRAKRRVRIYLRNRALGARERETVQRAAEREFRILEGVRHRGILRAEAFTESELGPSLVFERQDAEVRLDQFLKDRGGQLGISQRIDIVRQIAEAMRFAHRKRVVHRALCPENVLLLDPSADPVHVQVFNWQVGTRGIGSSVSTDGAVSPTRHIDELMEDTASLYRAPESGQNAETTGEHLDVFSLGAVAYHLFSGEQPASSAFELWERVTRDRGLDLAQVQDGVSNLLRDLVLTATRPAVQDRLDSVDEFLLGLDQFEAELSRPTDTLQVHPLSAKPGDVIAHGFRVKRRLGTGSTALALEVERDNEVSVLKVAMNAEHNDRLRAEGEVLAKLRHPRIVPYLETLEIEGHVALRTGRAGEGALSSRLREDGQLALDFLERFGRDLLDALAYLEAEGIPHRDLKPDNVGLARQGQAGDLHLVLFDFSLSRARIDDIRAGTEGYLEPFLKLRRPPRWDIAAERWSAAVLLYQMATGILPRWGDGKSDPAVLDCEATIESSAFDPSVREGLTEFFARALRRDPRERFDSAEAMGRAWVELFEDAAESRAEQLDLNETRTAAIESANLATQCVELPLSARAQNALQRLSIITVQDLLRTPLIKVFQQRGVGNQTRREIRVWTQDLRRKFPDAEVAAPTPPPDLSETSPSGETLETPGHRSVDHLLREILPSPGPRSAKATAILRATLGLDVDEWPSQVAAAAVLGVPPTVVNQELARARNRWRDLPSVTELRKKVHGLVEANGGLAEQGELVAGLLMVCGSVQVEPARTRHARAVLRAAVETEAESAGPRYWQYRHQGRVVIAASQEVARYALKLGERADQLAKEDPLPSPARSLAILRAIAAPAGTSALLDARLLRLAVAVSQNAALSSRQELYPRGMDPARALRLAQGAFFVGGDLTEDDLLRRVHSRYPEARPLPRRPQLDALVAELGLDLAWNPAALGGKGSYQSARRTTASLTSWTDGGGPAPSAAPESQAIQELDHRLVRARRDGAFLVLLTTPQRHALVHRAIVELHQPQVIDLDRLFIEEMRTQAVSRRIDWAVVRTTDQVGPGGPDWSKLITLAKWSASSFISRLFSEGENRTVLATFPGLLARYHQLQLLEEIRDRIGRRSAGPNLHGFWLLLASTQQTHLPQIDGHALPVLAPSQWVWVPTGWGEQVRAET